MSSSAPNLLAKLPRRRFFASVLKGLLAASYAIAAGQSSFAQELAPKGAIPSSELANKLDFYVGTYTGGLSRGIYHAELDTTTGGLSQPKLVAELASPSFLTIHPNGKYLYAVSETSRGAGGTGAEVVAYEIGADDSLKRLNAQSAQGDGPCYVSTDARGKFAWVANYGSGSVTVLPIEGNGQLSPASDSKQHQGSSVNPNRQKEPHAHCIASDPSNRWICAVDLGTDQVLVYDFDRNAGKLTPAPTPFLKQPPGSGPRHITFDVSGTFAAINNEMTSSVTLAKWDSNNGRFESLDWQSTLPGGKEVPGNSTSEAMFHPTAPLLYVANRGHDSIAIFKLNQVTKKLEVVGHQSTLGKVPRNFRIDPTGQYLLAENQESDTIQAFKINIESGLLEAVGTQITVGKPVCIRFVPNVK